MNIPTNPIFTSVTDPDDKRDIEIERAMPVSTVKSRPILFSGEMVRSILEGRKTQTRRVVKKPLHCQSTGCELTPGELSEREISSPDTLCPYGSPGDHLWVRETFGVHRYLNVPLSRANMGWMICYKADESGCPPSLIEKWRPSIHMPQKLSRITLEIVGIRVERLQDIGKDGRQAKDVLAEGITAEQIDHWSKWLHKDDAPAHTYGVLWDSLNGKKHPWASNPFCWVISFRRIKP